LAGRGKQTAGTPDRPGTQEKKGVPEKAEHGTVQNNELEFSERFRAPPGKVTRRD
jgi:hypothetical protein